MHTVTKKERANKPNCVLLGLVYSVRLISCRDAQPYTDKQYQ